MYCLSVLDRYGLLQDNSLSGRYLKCICPFHGEDTPSLNFNIERDSFYCFGCEKSGNVLDFVCEIEGCNYIQGLKILHGLEDVPCGELNLNSGRFNDEECKEQTVSSINKAFDYFSSIPEANWHTYNGKDFRFNYMLERGFERKTLKKFGVKINLFSDYPIIIPIIQFGKFKGYIRRRVLSSSEGPKYIHNKGLRKKYAFPGVNDWLEKSSKNFPLLICEGIIDMMSAWQNGYKNVASTLGWNASDYQISKIKKYNESVICALDNDEPGEDGYKRLKEKIGRDKVFRLDLKRYKDVNEMKKEEFNCSIKKILKKI